MRRYAMEAGFLARLLTDRRDLLAYARTLGTADAMRAARDDLYASARVLKTPDAAHPLELMVDAEGAAHIPIVGELTPSADPCGAFSAQAETEYGYILAALAAAEASPDVASIALDINSPGGYVDGVDEVAQAIAASSKPVVSYVGGMAASAAYWLASQADRIVALSPASEIGSIGVACEEYDTDEAYAKDGVAHRVYTSTDAPDKRPDTKTPEGRAKIVSELDALHAVFVRRVAEGRHVSAAKVNADFGRGGVLTAEAAMAAGMVDEVRGSHLSRNPPGVAGPAADKAVIDKSKEVQMDQDQLKAEFDKGVAAGIKQERERVASWNAFQGMSSEGDKLIKASIDDGAELNGLAQAKLTAAIARGASPTGDNAPALTTATPVGPAGASPAAGALSAQDVADLKAHGMTDAEIAKFAPEGKE